MDRAEMPVYVNGEWLARGEAGLSLDDRGALLGDAVYEVIRVHNGRPFALAAHRQRLARSLARARIPTAPARHLPGIVAGLIARNALHEGTVYCQVARGAAPRRPLPPAGLEPTVIATGEHGARVSGERAPACLAAVPVEDVRWRHCEIKSVMLMPNVLAAMAARDASADAALLHAAGRITEAASANAFAVVGGAIRTHPADGSILPGVTRRIVLRLAQARGWPVRFEPLRCDELDRAEEVFLTGTTTRVAAVTDISGQPVAEGSPGPVARALHADLLERIRRVAGRSPR